MAENHVRTGFFGWLRPVSMALATCIATSAASADTLDAVMDRGVLRCGVNPDLPGFSTRSGNVWTGFDVDYCRAIAAAVLDDGNKVEFVPLTARDRFTALQDGSVDVLIRDTAWTMTRDTAFGLAFAGINFFSGYGFMAHQELGVSSVLQLSGARICVDPGTPSEKAVEDFFVANSMRFTAVYEVDAGGLLAAYEAGECDAIVRDVPSLYAGRLQLASPDRHVMLRETLGKDPFGPVVVDGDIRWLAVVRWVHFALLNAEELGITAETLSAYASNQDDDIALLLGLSGSFGATLGLKNTWAASALEAVGNYGEIFDRNLGSGSPLRMRRGWNALWTQGGLQFAPAVR